MTEHNWDMLCRYGWCCPVSSITYYSGSTYPDMRIAFYVKAEAICR
jgi:hypothetical protein